MQNKKLQKLLSEFPDDMEVSVGNEDIFTIHPSPSYWDGCQQVLIRDPKLEPYYDVVGAKYRSHGHKLCISTLSIGDAIFDDPDLPVDFSELQESYPGGYKRYSEYVEKKRQETRDMHHDIELEHFTQFIFKQVDKSYSTDENKQIIKKFFESNFSWQDKIPEHLNEPELRDGLKIIPSYNERRERQWNEAIEVKIVNDKLDIQKK